MCVCTPPKTAPRAAATTNDCVGGGGGGDDDDADDNDDGDDDDDQRRRRRTTKANGDDEGEATTRTAAAPATDAQTRRGKSRRARYRRCTVYHVRTRIRTRGTCTPPWYHGTYVRSTYHGTYVRTYVRAHTCVCTHTRVCTPGRALRVCAPQPLVHTEVRTRVPYGTNYMVPLVRTIIGIAHYHIYGTIGTMVYPYIRVYVCTYVVPVFIRTYVVLEYAYTESTYRYGGTNMTATKTTPTKRVFFLRPPLLSRRGTAVNGLN